MLGEGGGLTLSPNAVDFDKMWMECRPLTATAVDTTHLSSGSSHDDEHSAFFCLRLPTALFFNEWNQPPSG